MSPRDHSTGNTGDWRRGFLPSGQMLANRYRILSLLGHGGMGEVYEAEDTVLGLPVALKTIRGHADENTLRRFQREVVLSRHISHDNVCRVYDFGSDERYGGFYTMELLRGETLADVVRKRGPLPLNEARSITIEVAKALEAAHAHGIVHRDLKPGNIFITTDGRVVVTDFGLAKSAQVPAAALLETGSMMAGTPAYMPPEQMTGSDPAPSVDLFALGVVMYEMTTGRLPWSDPTGYARLAMTPRPTGVDASWDAAVLCCLSPAPAGRFSSAADLRLTLQGRPRRRFKRIHGVIAGVLLLLLAAGTYYATLRSGYKPRPEALTWYNRGLAALHDGDYNSAARQFQLAVDADGNFAMAHARLAEAWAEQDYADRARQSMLQASTLALKYPVAGRTDELRMLAIQMTVARDFAGAVARYREIAAASRDGDTLFDLARALERNAETKEAIAKYREAVAVQNTHAAAWARLGALLGRGGDYRGATEAFDKAESIYNSAGNLAGAAEVRLRRAVMLTSQGQTREASRILDSALKAAEVTGFESQRIRILLRRGVLARLNEQEGEAERYASEALRLAGDNRMEQYSLDGLLDLGNVYLQKRDLAAAERHYGNALRIARSQNSKFHEARAMASIASVRSQQGRLDDARAGAEKALNFFRSAGYRNETINTMTLLAQVRSESGDSAGALATFEEQFRLIPPTNARALSLAHLRIGISLLQLERFAEALGHLDAAMQATESVTRAYAAANKAEILTLTGKYAEANKLLGDSSLLNEPSGMAAVRASAVRATAAMQEQSYTEALRLAEESLRRLGGRDHSLALELKSIQAAALSRSGNARRASLLCETFTREPANQRAVAVALLACAEGDLAGRRQEAAGSRAHEAAELFAKLGQPESQWRACTVEALAVGAQTASSMAAECENIRRVFAERWGKELWDSYITRKDIETRIAQLRRVSAAKF